MKYELVVAALFLGVALVATSAVVAFLYTPYTRSSGDTAITALTGMSLQIGNFLAVGAGSAVLFDSLASAGFRLPLVLAGAFGYAAAHLTTYASCLRITDLQGRPLDPDALLRSRPFRVAARALPPFAPGDPENGH